MPFCFNCLKNIDSLYEPCPHCGTPPLKKSPKPIQVQKEELINQLSGVSETEKQDIIIKIETERLLERGIECFNKGKAWLSIKNRTAARKEFQRALKYFDSVLKVDPVNKVARDYRSKASQKIS